MIYVTHDQIEALTLADRVAVMKDGVIQQIDRPDVVYATPENRFVAGFIGASGMNFLPGSLEAGADGPVFRAGDVLVPLEGYRFRAPPGAGRAVELGIRPEHVRLGDAAAGQAIRVEPTVDLVEPMGADALVWTTLAGHPFSVRVNAEETLSGKGPVTAGFPVARVSLFDVGTGARL